MHKSVKSIPAFAQIDEQLVDVVIAADIALVDHVAAEFLGHVLNTAKHPFSLIGESEFRSFAMHGLRNTVGNRAGADHAGNQNAFVGQKSHVVPLQQFGHYSAVIITLCPRVANSLKAPQQGFQHCVADYPLAHLQGCPDPDVTTDATTSHLTNPAKDAGQVIGYSHSTRLPKDTSQVAGYVE